MSAELSRKKVTFCVEEDQFITVPDWVTDIDAFRRWLDEDRLPEKLRVWWLKGEVFLDMSKEQIFTHVLVKTEFAFVLTGLAKKRSSGCISPMACCSAISRQTSPATPTGYS